MNQSASPLPMPGWSPAPPQPPAREYWTWADQISSYRFWALLVLFVCSNIQLFALQSFLPILYHLSGVEITLSGIVFTMAAAGAFFGFFIAWIGTRWKPVVILAVGAILQLIGGEMVLMAHLPLGIVFVYVFGFIFGLGSGIIGLGVPAAIAGGRGGAEPFVIAFGLMVLTNRVAGMFTPVFLGSFLEQVSPRPVLALSGVFTLIGLLFLIPVKPAIFSEPCRRQPQPLQPVARDPILMALLSVVAPGYLYLMYRLHGETAAIRPSPKLLSPVGAILASFIPFLLPVMLVTLFDVLNEWAVESGRRPFAAPAVVFVLGLLFPPAVIYMLQSSVNEVVGVGAVRQGGPDERRLTVGR